MQGAASDCPCGIELDLVIPLPYLGALRLPAVLLLRPVSPVLNLILHAHVSVKALAVDCALGTHWGVCFGALVLLVVSAAAQSTLLQLSCQ